MTPVHDKGFQWRALIVAGSLLGVYTLVAWRLFDFQVVDHEELLTRATRNRMMSVPLPARRGEILDRNGEILAKDRLMQEVYVDKRHLYNSGQVLRAVAKLRGVSSRDLSLNYSREELETMYREQLSREIAVLAGSTPEEISKLLENKAPKERVIHSRVDQDLAAKWETFLSDYGLKGLYLRPTHHRVYPITDYLVPIIGSTRQGKTNVVGNEGIELSMDELLQGEEGSRTFEADGRRRPIPAFPSSETPPKDGGSVKLSIDAALQEKVERLAENALSQYKAEKVILVLTRPDTGDILAMAGAPGYKRTTSGANRRDIVVQDVFEPGSIFKIVTFAAAFDAGVASITDSIFCENGVYSEGLEHPLHDSGSHGRLLASDVLAKSSNIGTFKLIMPLGRERFHKKLLEFGFGSRTGVPLQGESRGLIRNYTSWGRDSLSRIGIGHEIGVSALQMVMAGGAIANGGTLMKPRIILETRDGAGRLIQDYAPEGKRVISEEAAHDVTEAMVKVVTDGTGKNAAIPGLICAGKTGTAEKPRPTGGYYPDRYVVSYIGFINGGRMPLLGLAVVNDPSNAVKERYGSIIAAPLWKELMMTALEHEGMLPPAPTETPVVSSATTHNTETH